MTKKDNSQASQNPPATVKAPDDSKSPATSSLKTRDLEPTQGTTGTANSSSTGGAATVAQPPQKSAENKADAQAANVKPSVNPPASTPAAPVPTAVAWLRKNGANDTAIKAFNDLNYQDIEDLTLDVIREVLNGKVERGIIDRLVRIRTQELAKPQLLPAPALKPGTEINMSAPTLKGTDGVSMKLPDLGFATNSGIQAAVISAAELTPEQWVALAKNSDMLMGIDLAAFYEGRSSMPEESFSPVLNWVVPGNDDFFNCEHLSSRINTEITYSAKQASMVAAGFTSVDASVSTPYVSASVSVQESHKKAESSQSSKLYIVGTYDFDRVRVDLDQCTVVSQQFVDAVTAALHENDPKSALTRVFEKYGQVIGQQVTLGARLYFVHVKESSEVANMESEKVTVSASVAGAYAGFGGSVGVSSGSSTEKQQSSQSMHESISFQAIGGDVTLVNEPEKWKNTIKVPALWEVIRYDKLRYTYELLPSALKEEVLDVWNGPEYLEGAVFTFPGMKVTAQLSDAIEKVSWNGEFVGMDEGKTGNLSGFSIALDRKVTGLSVKYWGRFSAQGAVSEWCEDGRMCSSTEKGAALQGFLVELTGSRAKKCDLHYRARVAGKGWTDWVRSGESCGLAGLAIEAIQVLLTPAGAGTIRIPAASYVPEESANYFNNGVHGPGVIMGTSGEMVLTYKVYYGGAKPVRRRLEALFTAQDVRQVNVEFNQKVVAEAALDFATGGWNPDRQRVGRMGVVDLLPGWNVLKIKRKDCSPHFQEFRLVAEVIDIPALNYNRSTCHSSITTGAYGNGVIYVMGDLPVIAEYEFDFNGKKPTKLSLECVYAALESRPLSIELNKLVFNSALNKTTGGWQKGDGQAFVVGPVEVNPGKNILRVTSNTATPHIREFRLVPDQPFFDLVLE
ncbi:MAG: hypothetical protein FDX21_06845 [Chlorobium sp.]|nr:MAG: hypothetical protein FDX21_06845 [Chlorobium sp.]